MLLKIALIATHINVITYLMYIILFKIKGKKKKELNTNKHN
jgi:hypothetical protein